jgi:glucokinase
VIALGIDIGGTKIAAGLVTVEGTVLARVEAPTPATEGQDRILGIVEELGRRLIDRYDGDRRDIVALGVGSGGVIDPELRRVVSSTDFMGDWKGAEIGARLESTFGLPVVVYNDVHAHAAGEAFFGAGRGQRIALVAGIGTGIGGAVLIDGVPQLGAHGAAGHVGHISTAEALGMPCPCGRTGHLESISSGTGLLALYRKLGGDPSVRNAREIVARLDEDTIAHTALVTSASSLGTGLADLANVVDPHIVIVAGGMSNAGPLWWESLLGAFNGGLLPILEGTPLVKAHLGDDAAIVGAAKLALEQLQRG